MSTPNEHPRRATKAAELLESLRMPDEYKLILAGLVPAIHGSVDLVIKIGPGGIRSEYESHFPGSRPVLHVVLALDRQLDIGVWLCVDQSLQPISLRKALDDTFPMLPCATWKIAGDAGVKRAIRPIGHDVDPGAFHWRNLTRHLTEGNAFVDGRDKPGHDDKEVGIVACGAACDRLSRRCSARS
jgi:hypothetical protein